MIAWLSLVTRGWQFCHPNVFIPEEKRTDSRSIQKNSRAILNDIRPLYHRAASPVE